ncbi:MAG: glycosyltransferase [Chloroflexi bacterium]|nr:glycosyltransferase [Chloroflexota bacterium]
MGLNLGLVTIPFWGAFGNPVNMTKMRILAGACNKLYILTGEPHLKDALDLKNICIENVKPVKAGQWEVIRALKYVSLQLTICANMLKVSRDVPVIVFASGSTWFTLPVFWARILKKKVVLIVTGSSPKIFRVNFGHTLFGAGGFVFYTGLKFLEMINCRLAHVIVIALPRLVADFELERYQNKIVFGNTLYISEQFGITKEFKQRENIIGYVGRLKAEKGVFELIKSIPLILKKKGDIRFLIVGDGPLLDRLKEELKKDGCLDKVDFVGGVMPDKVPYYMNMMKFHILASHTEAFPAANLEAMACGAIAISNSVGGVPDTIIDGATGFLLPNNSPRTIADKVLEVWDHPELEQIQKKAQSFVRDNYSYGKATQCWRNILSSL